MKEEEDIKNDVENNDVIKNLQQAIDLLLMNDEYYGRLNNYLSRLDSKIDFWLHYLEFNKEPVNSSYRITKHIRYLRTLRRKVKNDLDLFRIYNNNSQKLCNKENRQMLLININKQDKINKSKKYSYKEYTEQEVNTILGINDNK